MTDIVLIDENQERGQSLVAALSEDDCIVRLLPSIVPTTTISCDCLIGFSDVLTPHIGPLSKVSPVIILAQDATIPEAVACIRRGALDYLAWPTGIPNLIAAVERASAHTVGNSQAKLAQFPLVGESPAMQMLKESISKAGPTDSPILILGQSGTGKELVARAIHASSQRSSAPLISINCATVPHNLIESELFGIEQYDQDRVQQSGLVLAANGGTLFLDEVAELPLAAQAKLLHVLQGENRRLGSAEVEPVNIRLIAASHRDLSQLVDSGQFRRDLYYRLNVVCFELPLLRARQDDVLIIAEWLLTRTSNKLSKTGLSFSKDATAAMLAYHWPGNVRELENAVERAVILSGSDGQIDQKLLAIEPIPPEPESADGVTSGDLTSLEDYFVKFVQQNQDQLTETELAEKLGISRKSLWERRQRLNIPRRKTKKRGTRPNAANASSAKNTPPGDNQSVAHGHTSNNDWASK